ncbi:MAG: hypothetical protein DCC71_04175 [Proteobacteria bacterium]|nr:MAG: hypothetical protein DCC71_04175 [Pseudomonadota bacterium]
MKRYYYAGGARVPLDRDRDRIAIDISRARDAGLDNLVAVAASAGARTLAGKVAVVPRKALGRDALGKLRDEKALLPVYRHGTTLLVPLPEVRVEFEAGQREKTLAALPSAPHDVEITDDVNDHVVLRPCSGDGDEAIDVANFVFEKVHPAAAAVRFVRFVPRPLEAG